MPYLVTCPAGTSCTLPRKRGVLTNDAGEYVRDDVESVFRSRGDIVDDADVTEDFALAAAGKHPDADYNEHAQKLVRKLTPAQAKKVAAGGHLDDFVEATPPSVDPQEEQRRAADTWAGGKA